MKLVTVPATEQLVATPQGELRKIDARVCVRFEPQSRRTTFAYQDMDLYDIRTVCRRIEAACMLHLMGPNLRDEAEQSDLGLSEDTGVCIKYDHWTRQVRYTRLQLDYHDAAVACAQAAAMCDHLLMYVHGEME